MKDPVVVPSLFSADFGHLVGEVRAIDAAGGDWMHVDGTDGRRVPNGAFGPMATKAIRNAANKRCDLHLMITELERYLEEFARPAPMRLRRALPFSDRATVAQRLQRSVIEPTRHHE